MLSLIENSVLISVIYSHHSQPEFTNRCTIIA
nr:MAG TPA_asm: hypothetical protein [Caudoviricetes sp.]